MSCTRTLPELTKYRDEIQAAGVILPIDSFSQRTNAFFSGQDQRFVRWEAGSTYRIKLNLNNVLLPNFVSFALFKL